MRKGVSLLLIIGLLVALTILEYYVLIPVFVTPVSIVLQKYDRHNLRNVMTSSLADDKTSRFSVIIVTFNEELLEKTINNVLENTPSHLLMEILIIDDCSDTPVSGWSDDKRIRIIRSENSLGLINSRILGGNEARGEFLAFIDAHVFVSPRWLDTPHEYLSEVHNPKTLVNFVNFKLNPDTFKPMSAHSGIGSSASFSWTLGIFWGGGSRDDDLSPITMGMFSTSKFWWEKGRMDTGMGRWGGENIEISLRTWLCGGQIRVAKDSYVAHAFRSKFPYKVNNNDIIRNNLRVASVWLDGEYLERYYKAAHVALKDGVPVMDMGDLSERLALKQELKCDSFESFVELFKNRAPCSKHENCGGESTLEINDVMNISIEDAFYKK